MTTLEGMVLGRDRPDEDEYGDSGLDETESRMTTLEGLGVGRSMTFTPFAALGMTVRKGARDVGWVGPSALGLYGYADLGLRPRLI